MADEAVLRVLLEGSGGSSPEAPAGSRQVQPAYQERPRERRPEPAGSGRGRPESALHSIIDLFTRLRGTLGGFLGPLAGAALDAAKAIRDMELSARSAAKAVQPKPLDLPQGKPAIGRAPDEVRREKMRRRLPFPPPEPEPIPVIPPAPVGPFGAKPPSGPVGPFGAKGAPTVPFRPSGPFGAGAKPPAQPSGPFGAKGAAAASPAPQAPQPQPLTPAELSRLRALRASQQSPSFNKRAQAELDELQQRHTPVPPTPAAANRPQDAALPAEHVLETAKPVASEAAMAASAQGALAASAAAAGAMVALRAGAMQATAAAGGLAKAFTDPQVSAASFAEGVGGAAKEASAALMLVYPPLGILAGVAGQAAESLGGLMHNMDAMANRYTGFGPGVATAEAMASIQHIAGEIRRGREVGASLAAYVTARTELQEKWEDAKAKFLVEITPAVISGMKLLEQLMPVADAVGKNVTTLAELMLLLINPVKWLRDHFAKESVKTPVNITSLSKPFLDALSKMQFAPGQGG